jgi:hypothetical protein
MIVRGILHYTTLYYPVYLGMIVAELGIPFLTHDLGDPIHGFDPGPPGLALFRRVWSWAADIGVSHDSRYTIWL